MESDLIWREETVLKSLDDQKMTRGGLSLYKQLFEGKFTTTSRRLKMSLLEKFYYNFSPTTYTEKVILKKVNQAVGRGNGTETLKILDVGCGGGCEALTKYGMVTGVDVSAASVNNAKKVYQSALSLDVTAGLPFGDGEFDFCFSSEVLGHIAEEDKDVFLHEIDRVLKPGGYIVISSETKGDNWLTRWLMAHNLYDTCWIEPWGHIGLITPSETINLIEKYFSIEEIDKTSTWLLSLDNYMVLVKAFPFLRIFKNNFARRIGNMLLYIPYRISLVASSFDSANDLVLLGRKKPQEELTHVRQ